MCLLVVCKPNAIPKREELTEGACANPHGFGFAIVADGKVYPLSHNECQESGV
jgi:hypothetical protein